jgi:hypothetical protein
MVHRPGILGAYCLAVLRSRQRQPNETSCWRPCHMLHWGACHMLHWGACHMLHWGACHMLH